MNTNEPYGDQSIAIGITIALGIVFAALIIWNLPGIIEVIRTEGIQL